MYYVYIIYSAKLNKKYIGSTQNLRKRLLQHKQKQTPFTRTASDWSLIYYETFLSKKDALAEEKFLKSGKGRDRLKFLLNDTMSVVRKGG